jgi:CBS domain-containing protein
MQKNVVTVKKGTPIKKIIEMLFKLHIGSLIITDEDDTVLGIVTERDILRIVAQEIPLSNPVEDVMTTNVITISTDSTFAEARDLMRLYRIRHLPAVDSKGKLVGLISLRRIIDEFFEIIPRTR